MSHFSSSVSDIVKKFNSDAVQGLSSRSIEKLQKKYGKNLLPEGKSKTIVQMFLAQLQDWLIYILAIAVIVTAIMGEYIDATIIVVVILVNAILGVVQEYKAGKALQALKNMTPLMALVKRDGVTQEISSEELVPGDIVILDAGRSVSADIRLIESEELKIEESSLTGESDAVKKDATFTTTDKKIPVGDRKNMAYMSTIIVSGRGIGVVVATGGDTEVGHIAHLLHNEEDIETPLEKRLDALGKTLGQIALAICLVIFVVSYFQGRDLTEMFLTSVSLAVASIPEGLAAIVAVVLSIGVTQMSKKNAIIKRLPAVETLGSVDIICSDKTGTLTQNVMTVVEVFSNEHMTNIKKTKKFSETEILLFRAMVLASDATYISGKKTGDPTEIALLVGADVVGIDREDIAKKTKRIAEFPFDSARKLMSVCIAEGKKNTVYTKGAVDTLLNISTHILENGVRTVFTEEAKQAYLSAVQTMSDTALRTLGVAYKEVDDSIDPQEMEKDLTFIGLVGMIDPPRESVKDSIHLAKQAGITPVMITGDYPNTAFAIAKDLGIATNKKQVITGVEIDTMTDAEFAKSIEKYYIFARVSPEHKVRIVKAFRAKGHVVSMTGDGVNDAPSLNAADIGVAMGITGTDVAKGASSMILTDDNFATIVGAVESGRNIYNNIKKSVLFLLTCNLGEVVTMFVIILLGWQSPLLAIQLLWINLLTDSLPAIALGMDPGDSKVMNEKPRKAHETFFSHGAGMRTAIFGSIIGIVTIFAFFYGYWTQGYMPWQSNTPEEVLTYARTMAFMVLILTQMFFTLSIRTEYHTIFSRYTFSNKWLILSIIGSIVIQITIIYNAFFHEIFHLTYLSWTDWDVIIVLSLVPLILNELRKSISRYF